MVISSSGGSATLPATGGLLHNTSCCPIGTLTTATAETSSTPHTKAEEKYPPLIRLYKDHVTTSGSLMHGLRLGHGMILIVNAYTADRR